MDHQEQMHFVQPGQDQGQNQGYAEQGGSQPGYQQAAPQPGAFYQYQPGVGFVAAQEQPQGQQSAQGFSAQPGMGQGQAPGAGIPGTPEGAEPKFDQNRMGEVYGMVNDVMNGEADASKLIGMLTSTGGDFWKGALVGAAAVFLLNNDAVKGAVAGTFGAFLGGEETEDAGE